MSYGTVEGVSLQAAYPYPQGPLASRISEAYAPAMTAASPATSVGVSNSISLEGGSRSGQPTFSMPAWQPYAYGKPAISSPEAYGHWYGSGLAENPQIEQGNAGTYGPPAGSGIYYPNVSQAGR